MWRLPALDGCCTQLLTVKQQALLSFLPLVSQQLQIVRVIADQSCSTGTDCSELDASSGANPNAGWLHLGGLGVLPAGVLHRVVALGSHQGSSI
jgi:hypothetical protein